LCEAYGYTPIYIMAYRENRCVGAMPLIQVKSWITGKRGISLPFTDHCAAIAKDSDAAEAMARQAIAHGIRARWKSVEWRGEPDPQNRSEDNGFWVHRIDLQGPEDELLARCSPSTRRAIHAGQRAGLYVEFSQTAKAIKTFYKLQCITRRRHGLPPQPFRFFRSVHHHVIEQGHGWVALARKDGEAIAGAVFFGFGSTIYYKFGASNHRHHQLRANNLVMWEAICRFSREGFATLDLGRTSLVHSGLRHYKLGWGASEKLLHSTKFDFRTYAFVSAKDLTLGWHNRIFKLMPIPVARLISRFIYRHIA
jgi:hypothetical protein